MDEVVSNTPENLGDFKGQFIVFFSEDENPQVLFSSYIAEEAYARAKEIETNAGKLPIVFRVQENPINNISQVSMTRI